MATVIDALLVTLGFDTRDYQKGSKQAREEFKKTKEEATTATKEIETQGKKAAEFFADVKREVTGLFTAFVGGAGLASFILGTAKANAGVGFLADNLNMSKQELWAWQKAMGDVGASAEDANASLQNLAKMRGQAQFDPAGFNAQYAGAFTRAGMSMQDLLGDPTEYILKAVNNLKRLFPNRRDLQQQFASQYLGISEAMFNMANMPNARQRLDQYKGMAPSDSDIKKAQDFQKAWNDLKTTLAGAASVVATSVFPMLQRLIGYVTDLAQHNMPKLIGIISAVVVAMGALTFAALPINMTMLAIIAAVTALGFIFGKLIAQSGDLGSAFNDIKADSANTRGGLFDIIRACIELGNNFVALAKTIGQKLTEAEKALGIFGSATDETFGDKKLSLIQKFVAGIVDAVHALSDVARIINDLSTRNWGDMAKAVADLKKDMMTPFGQGEARGSHLDPGPIYTISGNGYDYDALQMIKRREGFLGTAKWDVNHYRVGYGSDTKTDARTGEVTSVVAGTTVSRADAEADIRRRVGQLIKATAQAIGPAWNKLSDATKTMLVDLAYNYGNIKRDILKDVLKAAQAGNDAGVAAAIRARAGDNAGVNQSRRVAEAGAIEQNLPPGQRTAPPQLARAMPTLPQVGAQAAANNNNSNVNNVSNDNSVQNEANINQITINTQATDANGIAANIHGALHRQAYVDSANTGMS